MMAFRSTMLLLAATTLVVLGGCGGSDAGSGDARTAPAAGEVGQSPPMGTIQDRDFQLTAELQACMEAAGFTQDAPPTGGLAAWRHPSGARVVVGSDPNVTNGIASEIGSDEQPPTVAGSVVMAGGEEEKAAASACLA